MNSRYKSPGNDATGTGADSERGDHIPDCRDTKLHSHANPIIRVSASMPDSPMKRLTGEAIFSTPQQRTLRAANAVTMPPHKGSRGISGESAAISTAPLSTSAMVPGPHRLGMVSGP